MVIARTVALRDAAVQVLRERGSLCTTEIEKHALGRTTPAGYREVYRTLVGLEQAGVVAGVRTTTNRAVLWRLNEPASHADPVFDAVVAGGRAGAL